jgi:hypothetical protein
MSFQASRAETPRRPDVLPTFFALYLGSILLTWGVVSLTRAHYTPSMLDSDELEYYDLAGQMVDGHYDFNPRRVVGHTLVLAVLRKTLGDRILPIQLAVSSLFSLTAPLAYLLMRREFGSRRVALLGGLGVMAWPIYVRYGATLYSETLALPVFAATLLAFPGPHGPGSGRAGRWLRAGVMLGFCMHMRTMYLIFTPFVALVAYWREHGGRIGLVSVATLASGCLLVVLPWSIFMSTREHSFVLLSSNGGETLAGGLNPELIREGRRGGTDLVTPSGRITSLIPGKWVPSQATGFLSPREMQLPYTRQSKLLTERASAWIARNPGPALYLSMRKLTYMWGIYPFWNGTSQTVLGNIPLIGLMAVGMVAMFRLRRYFRETSLFWTLPIFVSVVALIAWGSWRFREPADLGLIALAATLPWSREVKRFLAGQSPAPDQTLPLDGGISKRDANALINNCMEMELPPSPPREGHPHASRRGSDHLELTWYLQSCEVQP